MKWMFGILAAGLLGLLILGGYRATTPEGQAKAADRERIAQCVKARDDKLAELATRRMFRQACQQMEDDFIAKWGIPSREL